MNYQTYLEKRNELSTQIDALQKQVNQLNREYLETSPLKKGDKVLVTVSNFGTNQKTIEAFIGAVLLPYSFDKHKFKYEFSACKKDGTMGKNSAGIYSYISVEKIE